MRKFTYFYVLFVVLVINYIQKVNAQYFKNAINKARIIMNDVNDTLLKDGIYLIQRFYCEYDYWFNNRQFKVEYTNNEKDITIKKPIFFILKNSEKAKYVFSTYKIRDLDEEWGERYRRNFGMFSYLVNPIPLATAKDFEHIYEFENKNPYIFEDANLQLGLTIKLNFTNDSLFLPTYNNKKQLVALIINNQIVSITDLYCKIENSCLLITFKIKNEEDLKLLKKLY